MIFRLTAKVESSTHLRAPFEVTSAPYLVRVRVDAANKVSHFEIELRVTNFSEHLPRFSLPEGSLPTLCIPTNPFRPELLVILQYVESMGSFWFGIERIHWDTAEERWIPETEEEKSEVNVFSHSGNVFYPPRPSFLDSRHLKRVLDERDRYQQLVVPLSFYREGQNEYRAKRYIAAYFNLYFFLEGIYGKGKTKNRLIRQAFAQSKQLSEAAAFVLIFLDEKGQEHHRRALELFFAEERCDWSTDGLLKLIVAVRGNLHHFSSGSSKRVGHPLNQQEFHTMAFVLAILGERTVAKLISGAVPE